MKGRHPIENKEKLNMYLDLSLSPKKKSPASRVSMKICASSKIYVFSEYFSMLKFLGQ